MKKSITFFLIFVLSMQLAYSETEIFSGKITTGTDKEIEGGIFRFIYDEQMDKVFVQTPETSLIIENGACKSNDVFRVCINGANFSYKNITTYVYYYDIDTVIYKLTGSLSVNTTLAPGTLLPQETGKLEITITNPTDLDIVNIGYFQDLDPFFVGDVEGCSLDGSQIRWQGSLKPKYDKVCSASIISDKEGAHSLSGNLTYFNGYETEKESTDFSITVLPKQLKVTQTVDQNIETGMPFYVNTSLENINQDEKIDVSITVELPRSVFLIKDIDWFSKELNVLKRSLALNPGFIYNYSLYLEASSQTSSPLKQKFAYTIKGVRDVIENSTFLNPLEPRPEITITPEYNELSPGQKFIVVVKLRNPSLAYTINNINASLNVPSNNEIKESLDKLMPNSTYTIISRNFFAPAAGFETESAFKLSFGLLYDFDGSVDSLNESLSLKLKPANNTIADVPTIPAENTTSIINATINETKAESKALEPSSNNTLAAISNEKPKPGFIELAISKIIDIEYLSLAVMLIVVLLAIAWIAHKIRKKRASKALEKKLFEELKENLPKTE